jgi:conjugative relaxase-like TrwC/TraI family protein
LSFSKLSGDWVRIAHRESVDEALKGMEEYLQARGGGNKPAITTGKMVAAQFEHTAARPDHATGYAAPQLHTHVVIMNLTKTDDGNFHLLRFCALLLVVGCSPANTPH